MKILQYIKKIFTSPVGYGKTVIRNEWMKKVLSEK